MHWYSWPPPPLTSLPAAAAAAAAPLSNEATAAAAAAWLPTLPTPAPPPPLTLTCVCCDVVVDRSSVASCNQTKIKRSNQLLHFFWCVFSLIFCLFDRLSLLFSLLFYFLGVRGFFLVFSHLSFLGYFVMWIFGFRKRNELVAIAFAF